MRKKACLLCMIFVVLLSGCGNAGGVDISNDGKTADSVVQKVLAEETVLEGEDIQGDEIDASLMKKYPKWFDKDGNIVYPYSKDKPKKWKKAWKNAGSYKKMAKKLQIPKKLVNALSTRQLLEAVENYPLLDITIYNSTSEALEEYAKTFYGMEALLAREDSGITALQMYCGKSIEITEDVLKNVDLCNQLFLEEYLAAQEAAYEAATEEQRRLMIETYRKNRAIEEELLGSSTFIQLYGFENIISDGDNPWQKEYEK